MRRKAFIAIALVALFALVAGGRVVYSFMKPPAEASGPIQAVPLSMETGSSTVLPGGRDVLGKRSPAPEAEAPATGEADSPAAPGATAETNAPVTTSAQHNATSAAEANVPANAPAKAEVDPPAKAEANAPASAAAKAPATADAKAPAKVDANAPAKADASARTAAAPAPKAPEPAPKQRVFQIEPDHSTARFKIDEVLRGEPKTVVGTTDQVAGQFGLLGTSLNTAKVGPILVNARTLATDNKYRNRAIKNKILKTDDFEYIRFEPKAVTGIPATASTGQTFRFKVTGDLTITNVTRPVTFDMEARFLSPTEMTGLGTTAFPYKDFQLDIPNPPIVASVADTVHLELQFQAQEVF